MGLILCVSDRRSIPGVMTFKEAVKTARITARYDIESAPVGKGHFGKVYKAYRKNSDRLVYAIKQIPKKKSLHISDTDFQQEFKLMQGLNHPNVLKYYEGFEDEENVYYVMNFLNGETLSDSLKKRGQSQEADVANLMRQAFEAVNYLHSHRVMHRDVKLENFMYATNSTDSKIVLIDFGFATRIVPGKALTTRMGTPYYCSPEIMNASYDYRADYWSLGIMMHILLVGRPPFFSEDLNALAEKVRTKKLNFESSKWEAISSEAKDLLNRLLTRDPDLRETAAEALEHPWIKMYQDTKADLLQNSSRERSNSSLSTSGSLEGIERGTLGNGSKKRSSSKYEISQLDLEVTKGVLKARSNQREYIGQEFIDRETEAVFQALNVKTENTAKVSKVERTPTWAFN